MSSGPLPAFRDVVIVGGGISGLYCAYKLRELQSTLSCAIIEAAPRLGGRIETHPDGTELGAAFLGPTQYRMLKLLEDLGLETYDVDIEGDAILDLGGSGLRFGTPAPNKSFFVHVDVNDAIRRIDADVAKLDPACPAATADCKALDAMSMEQYLRNITRTEAAFQFLFLNFKTLITTEPRNFSALAALWFIRNAGSFSAVLEGECWKTVGGNSQFVERLADRVGRENCFTGKPVCRVETLSKDRHRVSGVDFSMECRYVVFAMPPMQTQKVEFIPPLPVHRLQEMQKTPMGHCIKTFVEYPKRVWKAKGMSGRVLSSSADTTAPDAYDDSPKERAVVLGFIDADEAAFWCRRSEEERCAALAKQYARVFGDDSLLKPTGYKEKDWSSEPFIGGCFFGLPLPGVLTTYGRRWRAPYAENTIFFASTEAANHWLGYMEGSCEAAERAAWNIVVAEGNADAREFERVHPAEPRRHLPQPTHADPRAPSMRSFQIVCATSAVAVTAAAVIVARLLARK